jgi:hypothetical protein
MPAKEKAKQSDKAASPRRSTPSTSSEFNSLGRASLLGQAAVRRASLDPRALSPQDVLQLQRTVGNRAVERILARAQRDDLDGKNRTGMPDRLKTGVEGLSGLSMDDVRVHYNSSRPVELQALAYTQGTDIHVAPGQEGSLAHEAWHVVQQKQGRVTPTIQTQRATINDNEGLEREANVMGAKVMQMRRTEKSTFEFPLHQSQSATTPAAVIQRDITVGGTPYKPDAVGIVDPTVVRVSGQLSTWGKRTGGGKLDKKTAKAVKNFRSKRAQVEQEVRRLFRDRYDNREFEDINDLGRQVEQDIMLGFLGLSEFEGIPQQLDQFTIDRTDRRGPGSRKTPFRIYRTMPVGVWNTYWQDRDIKNLLRGHGGALGQALHYFKKSKNTRRDDVLVEFSFSGHSEEQLVDYNEIALGGEGKRSKGGKLGGKSEQNDVFDVTNIFSIDLGKNKDLIASLNPDVRAVEFANPDHKKEGKEGESKAPRESLSPVGVMVKLGRVAPGSLYIMSEDDWPLYEQFKRDHPEYDYSE